jgi:putative SOS response-associated peptidase YedK
MCGRFALYSTIEIIAKEFNVGQTPFGFEPSYNIAPSQLIVTVYNEGENKLLQCKWGFIPSWSKDESIGNRMINARAEIVAEKPTIKSAFKKQRCLVVSDGFYEWRKEGKLKIPVYVRLKSGKPLGLAGLYNLWTSPKGEQIYTCTIITTDANKLLTPVHNRMPVIISKYNRDLWLDPNIQDEEAILPLLKPYSSDDMKAYEVSQMVNSPSNDSPENIKAIGKTTH